MRFGVLGAVELYDEDGRPVPVGGPRQVSLLAFLLVHANQAVSNDELVEAVWAGHDPGGSLKRLQVAVARLRKATDGRGGVAGGPAALRSVGGGYLLSVGPGELDAGAFGAGVEEGRGELSGGAPERASTALRRALGLWRGPALADVAYEDFAQVEIRRLEELRLAALETRVEADLQLGRHAPVVAELEGLVAANPTRERFAAQLMLALYRCGRQADALDVYQRTRGYLGGELGLEPGPALNELQAGILNHASSLEPLESPGAAGSPRSLGGRSQRPTSLLGREGDIEALPAAGSLPISPNPTVGRDADIRAVVDQLRSDGVRLLTLVGPGGVGKTRLAIEAARMVRPDFPDGACFVELAVVSEPRELASAIARAVAAPLRMGEPPKAALLRFLGDRQLLLVLDNFEHLVDGAPLVAELLGGCPELTILLTTRESTRLAAERLYPVRPLEVPVECGDASPPELERYGAVAMFCDRARARDPDFGLNEATAPHVREICRRLDGLPLALELAAARLHVLSPAELAGRLDQALGMLTGGARDAPERQRTLRATIEWSHALLMGAERQAFARMAAFPGGATVVAAEAITGASLDTLGSLVDKQLLVRRDERLMMLETVREYALERLSEDPETDAVRDRLAGWCLRFAREATPHLVRADRARWLASLEAELPNALAALSWALDTGRTQLALELVGGLGDYWWRLYRWEEGLAWIEAALQQAQDVSVKARATALLYRARLTGMRRQVERHRNDLLASLELFRACDDSAGIASGLGHLAIAEAWTGDHEQASVHADEALRFAERSRDKVVRGFALRAGVAAANEYGDVLARAGSAMAYLRGAGDLWHAAWVCNQTAYRAITERRYEEALPWLDHGLQAARQLDDRRSLFVLRGNEGLARLFLHQPEQADEAFREELALCREAAAENLVDEPLLGLAAVTALQEDFARAARLAGAAHARTTRRGTKGDAVWSRLEDLLGPARIRFGRELWDLATQEGAELTLRDTIDLALDRPQRAATVSEARAPSRS
jgi:predicted ATPase/DNA-binding SARP family transcriptional activator